MGLVSEEYPDPCPWVSSHIAAYSATKAARFSSSAFSNRFLGRLKENPNRCNQFRQLLRLRLVPKLSRTNCLTAFLLSLSKGPVGQFQARRRWRLLHRRLQLLLFRRVKGGKLVLV